MAQRLTVRMNRTDSGMSWGFRLHGGLEFGLPLTVLTIVRNSVCDRCGLRPRDRVVAINNMNVDGATHEQTKMEIIRSGLEMDLVVYRDPPGTTPVKQAPPEQPPMAVPQTSTPGYLPGYGPVLAPTSKPSSAPGTDSAPIPAPAPAPAPTSAPAPAPASAPETAPATVPEPVPEAPAAQTEASVPEPEAPAKSAPESSPAPVAEKEPTQEPASAPSETQNEAPAATTPLAIDTSVESPPDTEVFSPKEVLASPAFREMSTRGSKPFSPGGTKKAIPNVTHSQFNSPMGLYSADNLAEVYAAQTEGIERELENLDVSKAPVGTKMSGSLQVID